MNLSHFGVGEGQRRRKALVILGAGASRGASFVRDQSNPLPPLDLDFFQQLSRMPESDPAGRLLEFVRAEFGSEVGLSMEQFFSEADYTDRFHTDFNVDPGPTVKRYRKALDDFLEALPHLLAQTTGEDCVYHRKLASLLYGEDCVLTFNYDCVMDRALRDRAEKRWDPGKGSYGFTPDDGAELWRDHSRGRSIKGTIRLLKMHGSANWQRTQGGLRLTGGPSEASTLKEVIIPPTWFKSLSEPPFGEIWRAARKEVRSARIIVVVGYSVPPTDLFSRSLLKVEAGSKEKREKLDLLVLVNPDRNARRSFVELVSGGLEPKTRILEFEYLSDLHSLFRRNVPDSEPVPQAVQVGSPIEAKVLREISRRLAGKLSEREAKVLRLRQGLDGGEAMPASDVARILGISEDEVEKIYAGALERLELIGAGV